MCSACAKKLSQTGGASVRALRDTWQEYLLDDGDDQTSSEYFLHFNDGEIHPILSEVISTHSCVLKLATCIIIYIMIYNDIYIYIYHILLETVDRFGYTI